MTPIAITNRAISRKAFSASNFLKTCIQRVIQRRALAQLDESRLADIGLSATEAKLEATKAPWVE